jgi:hypothetical protein
VRASKWGDGSQFFATASDPFTSRERGCINIYNFPSEDELVEGKALSFLTFICSFSFLSIQHQKVPEMILLHFIRTV